MKKIMIAEDDRGLTGELVIFLKNNGYDAEVTGEFNDPETIAAGLAYSGCDLVLLDIGLPGCDGQFLLKRLREKSDIPVIMITSRDNELDGLISGLTAYRDALAAGDAETLRNLLREGRERKEEIDTEWKN